MKKNVRTSRTSATPTSYAVSHDKKTGKNGDAGGKMTKFKSFDEIPDSFDAWAGDENERTVRVTAQVSSPVRWHSQQQQQPQHQESYGITKESYGITKESYGITQGMASMSFAPSMSSAPPLPYDHLHSKPPQRQQQQQQQQAPLPPQSKYFDYAEEEEEYGGGGGDDYSENANDPPGMRQAQQPQPQQPQRQGARVGGGGGGGNGGGGSGGGGGDVPPLPYESDSRDSKKQQDSIYFSKKPRPVDFKPYTMKQYKLIQPKEYVEISNIKPDLNSEELVAKRANANRIKEFSKNLQSYNKATILSQPKLPSSSERRDIAVSTQQLASKRQKAMEFARQVPRPKPIRGAQTGGGGGGGGRDLDYEGEEGFGGYGGGMVVSEQDQRDSKLMELEAQHDKSKAQMAAIRKSLGIK